MAPWRFKRILKFLKNYAEWLAVILSLAFTYFLGEEYRWSWFFGFAASSIYFFLVWKKGLLAESFLHLFYLVMALIGWVNWGSDSGIILNEPLSLSTHIVLISLGIILTLSTSAILKKKTKAKTPYVDSFTTVFSIIGTLLMISYFRENWLYWIVVDLVSIYLYALRKMWPTVVLFVLYTLLAFNAYHQWQ